MKTRIKAILEAKQLTYEAFGDSIQVTKATVGQWVRGLTTPTKKNLIEIILQHRDVNPDYLLWGQGPVLRDGPKTEVDHLLDKISILTNENETLKKYIKVLEKTQVV